MSELLMPAGDFEKLKYAFAYGADAVYAGVPIYSLRARENGFNSETLKRAIDYTHNLGKRIYLTMNIYAHNSKVQRFLDSFCEMADYTPDGFIMTDAGLIAQALKLRPNTVIHLSTQANVTNWASAAFWRDQGVRRIILSRELAIKEIAKIHELVPDVELEAFVHGAVCIAYSGRCLISNYLNYRDANQGTCTNSCRWKYKLHVERGSLAQDGIVDSAYEPLFGSYYVTEKQRAENNAEHAYMEMDEDEHGTYLMNAKDLCAIELLKDLQDAGVVSFKIEGRTKSIYYVSTIARAYRRAIDDFDAGKGFVSEHLAEVATTSNRTLMTGFLLKRPQEYGMNYEDGASQALTHRFVGQIVEYDLNRGIAWVEFKNKVEAGQVIEWVEPHQTTTSVVNGFIKPNGEVVYVANGGCKLGIEVGEIRSDFALLRMRI